ncbi:MAG: response regulator [Acetobacteraceae bacterium]|jgi:two-component system chemotaxis response regulator CheY
MGKKILIVDDSPTILMSMRGMLERAGHAVSDAASGEAAVSVLKGGLKPDLVITDFHMGAMDGIELVRQVRKMASLRFIPVLMVTTESQQAKRMEAKAAGATGWLVKPVQPEALLQVIRQVVPGA